MRGNKHNSIKGSIVLRKEFGKLEKYIGRAWDFLNFGAGPA
jgi:hypothetical protein